MFNCIIPHYIVKSLKRYTFHFCICLISFAHCPFTVHLAWALLCILRSLYKVLHSLFAHIHNVFTVHLVLTVIQNSEDGRSIIFILERNNHEEVGVCFILKTLVSLLNKTTANSEISWTLSPDWLNRVLLYTIIGNTSAIWARSRVICYWSNKTWSEFIS